MKNHRFLSLCCVTFIYSFSILYGQVLPLAEDIKSYEDSSFSIKHPGILAAARGKILEYMHEKKIPGLSVAVSKNSSFVWCEGFGTADKKKMTPVKLDTKFRVGSVSKSFTSAALGTLYERGKIDINQQVRYYVPEFPEKQYPFTVKQLAGHLAGIRSYDYSRGEFISKIRYNSIMESLGIFMNDSLLFKPGTKYLYTTFGYSLLSEVIEKAAGLNFLDFMRQDIFDPLDMKYTEPDYSDKFIEGRASCYSVWKNNVIESPQVDNSNKWGGGGFLSTCTDMLRFGNGLLENKIISPVTRELLFTSLTLSDGTKTGYGLGWSTGTDKNGRRFVYHVGSPCGSKAYLVIFPEDKVVMSLADNLDADISLEEILSVCELFLESEHAANF